MIYHLKNQIKKVRREGGGRKKITDIDQTIMTDLENLVEPVTRGDPESPLRWSCKSTRKLAEELNKKKELVGNFKNGGREYRRKGDPERV